MHLPLYGFPPSLKRLRNVLPQGSCVKTWPRCMHQLDGHCLLTTSEGVWRARQAAVLADHGCRPWACGWIDNVHTCRTRCWRGLAASAGAACPPSPRRSLCSQGRSSGLALAGLCAADRDAVEGFPWPGRPRGWAPLGSRSPGLPLAAAVLPAGRRRKVRCARSCVKARAARSPAPLGPRLDTRSLRVGCAA